MNAVIRMFYVLAIAAVIMIAACVPNNAQPPATKSTSEVIEVDSLGEVRVIVLRDGTRCAVYDGYKAGGISCDWVKQSVVEKEGN